MAQLDWSLLDTNAPGRTATAGLDGYNNRLAQLQQQEMGQKQMRLADLGIQSQEGALGDQQLARDDAMKQRGIYRQYGGDLGQTAQGMIAAGYGKEGIALQKDDLVRRKDQAALDQTEIETKIKRANYSKDKIAPLLGNPSNENIARVLDEMVFDKAITREQANEKYTRFAGMADMKERFEALRADAASADDYIASLTPKPAGQSDLSRLLSERDSLPPGDPRRKLYDQQLAKLVSHAPGTNVNIGEKLPLGYRWNPDGTTLSPIPGGPADKLSESQQKQLVGVNNVSNAITAYRERLKSWKLGDELNPSKLATMGTSYKNLMLQAKEAYNLGVLNGPDLSILESVITDPASWKGALTPNTALDAQAVELDRILKQMGAVSAQSRQPQSDPTKRGATPQAAAAEAPKSRNITVDW